MKRAHDGRVHDGATSAALRHQVDRIVHPLEVIGCDEVVPSPVEEDSILAIDEGVAAMVMLLGLARRTAHKRESIAILLVHKPAAHRVVQVWRRRAS